VKFRLIFAVMIILVITSTLLMAAETEAASGLPETLEFGVGARLDPDGPHLLPAINVAAGIGMDWIAINFEWERMWKNPEELPDLTDINQLVSAARQANLNVMISILNAPGWASGQNGPDPDKTADLVTYLGSQYPENLLAIELFPYANTVTGWGASPNPSAYLSLLIKSQAALKAAGLEIVLVAGGLTPLGPEHSNSDMDDLVFLEGIYKNGGASYLPIISLRLENITGEPMYFPTDVETRFLRRYEEVRRVMLQHQHQKGLIWITGFSWPKIAIQPSDVIYLKSEEQTAWLNKAYRLMRAQLYIGAIFFTQLNPSAGGSNSLQPSLVLTDGSLHPACESLGKLITMNGAAKSTAFIGNISKKTPNKLAIKPSQP
jgi:hypothetical protein